MAKGLVIHNFDLGELIKFAETANGGVFIKTQEGDVLNLKSKLTQFLAISGSIDWGKVGEAVIICDDPDDETKLFRMNLYGHEE